MAVNMASRLIVLRERVVNTLHGAFDAWSSVMTTAVNERIGPFLAEGEAPFDLTLLQRVLQRMVGASFERIVEADKAHVDQLTDDIAPRLERDQWVDKVRQKLIDIRRIAQGLVGPDRVVEIVAIDGSTAHEPELLWRQAEHTLSRLRSPDFRLPATSTQAVDFDPLQLADELEPLVTGLRASIATVQLEERSAALSLQSKLEEMDEHDQLISASKHILVGFYLLARRPDLASRVRISLPRQRRSRSRDDAPNGAPDASTGAETAVDSDGATATA